MNDVIERFEGKFIPEPNSGCWLWTGALDRKGYARFGFEGRNSKGNRAAYKLYKCDPGDFCVLHRCDVRCCVNPDHLFLGTQVENVSDCKAKGRTQKVRGEAKVASKLKAKEVLDIYSKRLTRYDYRDRYGVAYSTVARIQTGKVWSHVTGGSH